MTTAHPTVGALQPNRRLNGWKEIAACFAKGVRTVQRWERELGLPFRRTGTEIVYKFTAEPDASERGFDPGAAGLAGTGVVGMSTGGNQ